MQRGFYSGMRLKTKRWRAVFDQGGLRHRDLYRQNAKIDEYRVALARI